MNETEMRKRLDFKLPVDIKKIKGDPDIVTNPDKIEIRLNAKVYDQLLPDYMAMAKMAETDYLLVNFYSQPEPTPEEERYLTHFHRLCQPLVFAWEYGIMRRYLPEIYEKYIATVFKNWQQQDNSPDVPIWDYFSQFAILSEDPANNVKFHNYTPQPKWDNYLALLAAHVHDEPDVKYLLLLAAAAGTPYSVKIVEDKGMRYYDVRRRG